ncbi:hypothetical protein [Natronogracilivirga saccharolytica]|uniref:Uncharacterized protein n=1 Tax=Natronogracilivirga saccharolytica TaxID=2812953 RepID=A0A8J7UUB5_9BACT|nr:hypothetical protein [Natronogracilivirga saccharolytica]MBP3191327.1 hypothetical protein [Natronogracilivirga saccharolytica]
MKRQKHIYRRTYLLVRCLRPFLILLVALCTLSPGNALAQFLSPFSIGGETSFNRQLDAMRWQYEGGIDLDRNNLSVTLQNSFRSRLYLSDGEARNIQDENELRLSMRQWLNDQWAVTGEAQSYSFTTTNLLQNRAHLGMLYNPYERIELSLMGGIMSDRRSDNLDQGWSGLFRARSRPVRTGDFIFQPSAEAHYADLDPRTSSTYRVQTEGEYRFDDFIMRGDIVASRGTREGYQPSSFFNRGLTNIIESIRNDSTAFDLQVRVPVIESLHLEIDLYTLSSVRSVNSRPYTDDLDDPVSDTRTQRREVELNSRAEYEFRRNQIALGFNFGYINRGSRLTNTEDFTEDQVTRRNEILRNSNFDQSRFELFTRSRWRIADNNELLIQGQAGILRYDTPEINQDDRDELNYRIQIINRHVFSPYFDITLRAGGEATHYVYLSAARSIENNWRRTIRLAPEMQWQPLERLRIRNSLLVRANYTVEDYQLEDRPKNDQSSREFAAQTNIEFMLTDSWSLELGGSRNELRIGRLYWDSFEETPTDTLITYNAEAMAVMQTGNHRIGLGGRIFYRRDYLPQAAITAEIPDEDGTPVPVTRAAPGVQTTRQIGPNVDINLNFFSGNRLVIRGWMQQQSVRRRLYINYTEDVADAFREEERRAVRRTYPNLEIRAVFSF